MGRGGFFWSSPLPRPLPTRSSRGEGVNCGQGLADCVSSTGWGEEVHGEGGRPSSVEQASPDLVRKHLHVRLFDDRHMVARDLVNLRPAQRQPIPDRQGIELLAQ